MHHAGGAEYRQTAQYAEARIPGFQRDCFAAGDRDGDLDIGGDAMGRAECLDLGAHQGARYWIDRRFARRDRQARTGHHAHAFACGKDYAASVHAAPNSGDYRQPMGYIRIVTGILDDACRSAICLQPFQRKREGGFVAFRQADGYGVGKVPGQKRSQGRLGCGGCASARRPAATQSAVRFCQACIWFICHKRVIGRGSIERKDGLNVEAKW